MSADVETVVVGAGVVGLAVARALALRGQSVVVLERHGRIGSEISSRNSEVIHAGIYYPPGSLRARFCVAGKEMLYRFADETGVGVRRCGKLLVATQEAEMAKLAAFQQTASANGVGDLVALSGTQARALEPDLACVGALLSPSTGVIDSHALMLALEGHLTSLGGAVVLNTTVTGFSLSADGDFRIVTRSGEEETVLSAARVVLCAGLGTSQLATTFAWRQAYAPPRTYPAKGHYFSLAGRQPFRHLIYPMPQGAWLGVHLTLDVAGRAKFGPDIQWQETVDYAFEDEGGARQARFEREVRRYWPGLPDGALAPDYTGVRPKIYREGEPAADFTIHDQRVHGVTNLVALYGIESPGLTSSLALGEHVAGMLSV